MRLAVAGTLLMFAARAFVEEIEEVQTESTSFLKEKEKAIL